MQPVNGLHPLQMLNLSLIDFLLGVWIQSTLQH